MTTRPRNEEDLNLITDYGYPNQIIETHYGPLRRIDWQREEIKRIGGCKIVYRDGLSAIMRLDHKKNVCSTVAALKENMTVRNGGQV